MPAVPSFPLRPPGFAGQAHAPASPGVAQRAKPRAVTALDARLGARLREARTFRRLSLEALGAALGVSYQMIQKYENGKARLSAGRLVEAASFLGIAAAWFFEDIEIWGEDDTPPALGPAELKLLDAFARIAEPSIRHGLTRFIAALADGRALIQETRP